MTDLVRKLHSTNHIVILLGDFNDDLNVEKGRVNKMLRDSGLRNTINMTNKENTRLPSTYYRGRNCLDMIAISDGQSIPPTIVLRAGYFPYYHHFHTDHRAIYCDLDTDILFGCIKPDLTRQSYRAFTTNNVKKKKNSKVN
jgi:hypothetical protein